MAIAGLVQLNTWGSGVFDVVADPQGACDVCCCYPCGVSRVQNAAEKGVKDTLGYPTCIGATLALLCPPVLSVLVYTLRQTTRQRYHIDGTSSDDALLSLFCQPCVLCQLHRELSSRGIPPGGTMTPSPRAQSMNDEASRMTYGTHDVTDTTWD